MDALISNPFQLKVTRPPKNLRQLAYDKLRGAIFNAIFEPGDRLIERDLCDQLDVSRSVIREVLRQLEAEGLVEIVPKQGPVVATLSPSKAKEIYEIRALLEMLAVKACVEKGNITQIDELSQLVDEIDAAFEKGNPAEVLEQTNRFYEQLFAVGEKPFAWEMVQSLNARINHLRLQTISSPKRHKDAIEELRKIILAIRAQDILAAEKASSEHIQSVSSIGVSLLEDG